MDALVSVIYHEKQQPGSMLCAQHALNNLLQGSYFTAPDLSHIASGLDNLEETYDNDNTGNVSTNMDDTGFFSIQVLERALQVWGLHLVRWRSEEMRPYQEKPYVQLAFILNLNQHWFTLRRFGPASPVLPEDEGLGHWFNLNSFLEAPERVSHLYLGMVLEQAEQEGYSVFAVVQVDSTAPLALPRSPADDLAAAIPESSSSSSYPTASRPSASLDEIPSSFEDEDMELQAALQASYQPSGFNSSTDFFSPPPTLGPSHAVPSRPPAVAAQSSSYVRPSSSAATSSAEPEAGGDEDPVAASMARNRAMLERMRRHQEMALRVGYDDEIAQIESRQQHTRQESGEGDDEDEELRRAILESQALAEAEGHGGPDATAAPHNDAPSISISSHGIGSGRNQRNYDDEDEELQAALRASLEHMPPGFTVPPSPHPRLISLPVPNPVAGHDAQSQITEGSDLDTESEVDHRSLKTPEPEQPVDVDEMRRKRLARFGG